MNLPSIEDYRAQYTPLPQAEIDEVDAGINDRLAEAATEPLDPDPLVAAAQQDRDRYAYLGDFDAAEHLDRWVLEHANPRLDFEAEVS